MANEKPQHDLTCALNPGLCKHEVKEITSCVICGRDLKDSRVHLDTCEGNCFRALFQKQTPANPEYRALEKTPWEISQHPYRCAGPGKCEKCDAEQQA